MYNHSFSFYGAVLGIIGFTIGPTLYLGHKHNAQAELLDKAAERLSAVPAQFGPWLLREEQPLNETALVILAQPRYLCRTYVNRDTGEAVSIVLLAGLAGPTVVHTPDICMPSREYENIKPSERIEIVAQGKKHAVFSSVYRAKTLEGQKLNVYYAWSRDGDRWEAPDYPRIVFAPLPILYKIQVVCAEPSLAPKGPSAGATFLADLLPLLASPHAETPAVN